MFVCIFYVQFRDVNELHWTAVVGEYDLSKQEDGKMVFPVKRILIHPKVLKNC